MAGLQLATGSLADELAGGLPKVQFRVCMMEGGLEHPDHDLVWSGPLYDLAGLLVSQLSHAAAGFHYQFPAAGWAEGVPVVPDAGQRDFPAAGGADAGDGFSALHGVIEEVRRHDFVVQPSFQALGNWWDRLHPGVDPAALLPLPGFLPVLLYQLLMGRQAAEAVPRTIMEKAADALSVRLGKEGTAGDEVPIRGQPLKARRAPGCSAILPALQREIVVFLLEHGPFGKQVPLGRPGPGIDLEHEGTAVVYHPDTGGGQPLDLVCAQQAAVRTNTQGLAGIFAALSLVHRPSPPRRDICS